MINCFLHARVLLYADDLNIFLRIFSIEDSLLLQDLNEFNECCRINRLYLNIAKCKYIQLTKRNIWILLNILLTLEPHYEIFLGNSHCGVLYDPWVDPTIFNSINKEYNFYTFLLYYEQVNEMTFEICSTIMYFNKKQYKAICLQ